MIKGDFRKFKVYKMCKETCNNQNRPASLSINRQRLNFEPAGVSREAREDFAETTQDSAETNRQLATDKLETRNR